LVQPASSQPPLVPPRPARPPAAPQGGARGGGDRLAVSREAARNLRANLGVGLEPGQAIALNGAIQINGPFLVQTLRKGLKGAFGSEPNVRFDAKRSAYEVSAMVSMWGLHVPIDLTVKPRVDGNQIVLDLDQVGIPAGRWELHPPFARGEATRQLAAQLTRTGIQATADSKHGTVRLDTNWLLRSAGALPDPLSVDTRHTALGLQVAPSGDVTVQFHSDQAPAAPEADPSGASRLSMHADAAAMQSLIQAELGPAYQLKGLEFRPGGATMKGDAEWRDGTALLVGLGALLLALNPHAGSPGDLSSDSARAMVALNLDVQLEDKQITLTPSKSEALPAIADQLKKAHVPFTRDKQAVHVDLGALAGSQGADLEAVAIRPEGMDGTLRLDLDSLLVNG
jgi:hypothetical protein